MALDQTANFVRGNTDASTDSTQTTISVVDASIFPDPTGGEYNLVFWDDASHPRPDQDPSVEIVRVTARDTGTDDLTVTRGQEGTTGASHPSGSALQLSPTAKMFGDIASRYVAEGENFDGQGTSSFTNLASVVTDEGEITGETYIEASRGPSTSTSSGSRLNVFDGESTDNRNEFDSSQQFTPDKDGRYIVNLKVEFDGSTTAGDTCYVYVWNEDTNSQHANLANDAIPGVKILYLMEVELTAGTTYTIKATNVDSSFVLSATGIIKRGVMQ